MQVKSRFAVVVEKQSSEYIIFIQYIGLVNGRGKDADIITEWDKKQIEFTKQGLQIRRDSYCFSGQ